MSGRGRVGAPMGRGHAAARTGRKPSKKMVFALFLLLCKALLLPLLTALGLALGRLVARPRPAQASAPLALSQCTLGPWPVRPLSAQPVFPRPSATQPQSALPPLALGQSALGPWPVRPRPSTSPPAALSQSARGPRPVRPRPSASPPLALGQSALARSAVDLQHRDGAAQLCRAGAITRRGSCKPLRRVHDTSHSSYIAAATNLFLLFFFFFLFSFFLLFFFSFFSLSFFLSSSA